MVARIDIRGQTYRAAPVLRRRRGRRYCSVNPTPSVKYGLVSTQLINPDYTGACCRVRRASDNAEQDIGFSAGVLDTTALEAFCGGSQGFLVKWYGQGDAADVLDFEQPTAGEQPFATDAAGLTLTSGGYPGFKGDAAVIRSVVVSPGGGIGKLLWSIVITTPSAVATRPVLGQPAWGRQNQLHISTRSDRGNHFVQGNAARVLTNNAGHVSPSTRVCITFMWDGATGRPCLFLKNGSEMTITKNDPDGRGPNATIRLFRGELNGKDMMFHEAVFINNPVAIGFTTKAARALALAQTAAFGL